MLLINGAHGAGGGGNGRHGSKYLVTSESCELRLHAARASSMHGEQGARTYFNVALIWRGVLAETAYIEVQYRCNSQNSKFKIEVS